VNNLFNLIRATQGGGRRGSGLSIIALSLTCDCKPRKAKGAAQT
jgi:hypothetical protein